ncbi:MAG TPA: hypothetical protein VNT53_04590 [Pseudolysinimonas sp.]|nr:hypothetical protein [Pseudolysinimonas sp.]
MLSFAVSLLAAEEELAPMIAPPIVFAGITAAVFVILAFITWSYRDVANRHSDKAPSDHSGHH